jgi:hypothetical protein
MLISIFSGNGNTDGIEELLNNVNGFMNHFVSPAEISGSTTSVKPSNFFERQLSVIVLASHQPYFGVEALSQQGYTYL